jgi:hypothetical protein
VLSVLLLLLVKHWYVDFIQQTPEQIKYKGTYGHLKGIEHSLWHGVLTAGVFYFFIPALWAIFLGLVDFLLHYHIDYVKMRYGEQDISKKEFWKHLGLDQLAHQITYILLIAIATAITIGL